MSFCFGGPSSAEKTAQSQEAGFTNELMQDFGQRYAQEGNILSGLTNVLTPIEEAGPNQRGFSAAEEAAMNTSAIDTTGGNYANAVRATQNNGAGKTVAGAPESGVTQAITAGLGSAAAGQLSTEENQIVQADYATGRSNFNNAVSGLGGVASAENPNGLAGEANTANKNSFGEADTINTQQNQADEAILGTAETAITGGAGLASAGISAANPNADTSFLDALGGM